MTRLSGSPPALAFAAMLATAAGGHLTAGCCSTLNLAHLSLRSRFHLLARSARQTLAASPRDAIEAANASFAATS